MATATIVSVYHDTVNEYADVVVLEADGKNHEYIGAVPLTGDLTAYGFPGQQWTDLTLAQKKSALTVAVKAVRDAQRATLTTDSGISGTVTI